MTYPASQVNLIGQGSHPGPHRSNPAWRPRIQQPLPPPANTEDLDLQVPVAPPQTAYAQDGQGRLLGRGFNIRPLLVRLWRGPRLAPPNERYRQDPAYNAMDSQALPVRIPRWFNPGIAAPAGIGHQEPMGGSHDGSWLHVPHYPQYTRPAGRVAMGPKTVDNTVTVPAVFVGAPQ